MIGLENQNDICDVLLPNSQLRKTDFDVFVIFTLALLALVKVGWISSSKYFITVL